MKPITNDPKAPVRPVWISGPSLRSRWNMPLSTFHYRVAKGVIPAPVHPFGPNKPYWLMDDIEQFEQAAINDKAGARAPEAVPA